MQQDEWMILVRPAANCPLQGCASCHSWLLRYFSAPALMLVAATVYWEPCQEKSCTVVSTVWEDAAFPLRSPQKEDCIMKLCTVRWYGFKLPVPFSWGSREQQSYEKSSVNHGYSRKENQSAAPLKTTGKTQYYQTVEFLHRTTMWTVLNLWENSLKRRSQFFNDERAIRTKKINCLPIFLWASSPLPEIR